MLAKALAKESGATFINVAISSLTNKWFGESNKLVAGLFGLARKTQPCIIFIDEIDSFLRERTRGDHEATAMMKAEFMTHVALNSPLLHELTYWSHRLWDGLLSSKERIMVLGATNRPNDIDSAILRRMPKRFAVRLPDTSQRRRILTLVCISCSAIYQGVRVEYCRSTDAQRDRVRDRFPLGRTSAKDEWLVWIRPEGIL